MQPTQTELQQAYYDWLHATNRVDLEGTERAYFMHNWRSLPGLEQHVANQIAQRDLRNSTPN